MDARNTAVPRPRKAPLVLTALAAFLVSASAIVLSRIAPEEGVARRVISEGESVQPSLLTFKARSAAQLARILDEAWGGSSAEGEAPGIAPLTFPPDMGQLDPDTRRTVFLRSIVPHLLEVNSRIGADRKEILRLADETRRGSRLSQHQLAYLTDVCRRYRVGAEEDLAQHPKASLDTLLRRVDEVPLGLALAQAAWESAWGVSKLAREDHGLFGQSVAELGEGVSARKGPNGVWYARFRGIREAVEAYVRNLNTYEAYEDFRRIRGEMRKNGAPLDAGRLAAGLLNYSEMGQVYVDRLREVIRSRDILAFSKVRLAQNNSSGVLAGVSRRDGATLALGLTLERPDA